MLTPGQINSKQFTVVRLRAGYDQDEVDDFLDRVQEDYSYLHAQRGLRDAGVEATQVIPKMPSEAPPTPSEMIAKVLAVAEETAEKHKHEAELEAASIIRNAKNEAEILIGNTQMDATNIVDSANKTAQQVISDAEAEKHRIIGELEDKRSQLKEKVDELIRVETEVTTRMRTALERWNT